MAKDTQETEKNTKKSEQPEKEEKDTKKPAKDSKKSDSKDTKKEPGKIGKWFKDLKIEFKKVVWPTKKTVINNTSVVLAVVIGSALLVGLLDEGFLTLLRLIYQ